MTPSGAEIDLWPGAIGPPTAPTPLAPQPAVFKLPCSAQNDTLSLSPSSSFFFLTICHTFAVALQFTPLSWLNFCFVSPSIYFFASFVNAISRRHNQVTRSPKSPTAHINCHINKIICCVYFTMCLWVKYSVSLYCLMKAGIKLWNCWVTLVFRSLA